MPGWKGANDIRRFISFTLARRQDCLLSRRQTDCSWGDKWNDLNWSLSWWLASPLSPSSGLQPRWFFSLDMPWVISGEAEDSGNTSKGLRLDGNWWSWVLDIIGSCSSICYRKVTIENQNPLQVSIWAGDDNRKCMSPQDDIHWQSQLPGSPGRRNKGRKEIYVPGKGNSKEAFLETNSVWFQIHQEPERGSVIAQEPEPEARDTELKLTFWSGRWSHPGWRDENRKMRGSVLQGPAPGSSCLLQDYQQGSLAALPNNLLHIIYLSSWPLGNSLAPNP